MAQGLPVYTRLREDSDEEEVVPSVASEEVKPPEPPPASQTPVAAETEEKAPEEAPPVQSGFQPVVPTAMPLGYQPAPASGYEPAAVPVGVTPGYQPAGIPHAGMPLAGMPPAGPTPVAATALNTTTVVQMQPTGGMAVLYPQSKPENFLVLSVFSMLCCCFIFGVIALIYSLRVNSSWDIGDYEDARSASKTAKHWNIAAIVTGGIFAALGGVILLINIIGVTVVNASRH